MAVQTGKGGEVIWETDGTEAADYTAWATSTAYGLDDEVTTGTGASTRYFRCLQDHTAASTNQPPMGAAALEGVPAQFWKEIARGQISALSTWSLSEQGEQNTFQVLDEDNARVLTSTVNATGQLLIGYEPDDIAQAAMLVGAEGVMEIRPRGTGSGRPKFRFNANITSRAINGEQAPQTLTVAYGVSGTIDRANQV